VSFHPSLPEDGVNVSRVHPLREAALLTAGVVALGAVLVIAVAVAIDLVVPHLSPDLEVRIFSPSWLIDGESDEGEETDPRLRAARELLGRLERHWSGHPYRFRLGVWSDERPNAVALPGGWIAVTEGLLEGVRSENELAMVLGHELGHFHNRDHLRGLGRGVAVALFTSALAASGAGTASQLAGVAGQLAQRAFDREQELAADRFALALVAAEYGHVVGASDFFQRQSEYEVEPGRGIAGYFSTHPLSAERIEALANVAAERRWSTLGTRVPLVRARPGAPTR
jgi:Zn-dependent protease with chaperone function